MFGEAQGDAMVGMEGVGEAVTGGLAARAVEPQAGEGAGHGEACLNCGTALRGDFCHRCGQRGHVHRTLTAWWHDLAHGVLHLDGKIWRTLPLLAWRPGELTRRYVEGERARFVSPMALFLFSVFMMFAVFSTLGGPVRFNGADFKGETTQEERAEAQRDFDEERAESQAEMRELRAERARLAAAGKSTLNVDIKIETLQDEIALRERLFKQAMALIGAEEQREAEAAAAKGAQPKAGPVKVAAEQADEGKFVLVSGADGANNWFNDAYKRAKENPSLLFYKLQTNAYKFSWALIPISVPFVWLMFLHRRRYRQFKAYDHTVFVTYSVAFMSLGVIALSLLRPLGISDTIITLAIILIPPVHMYRQLKGTYQLSRWSALWRTFMLLVFAAIAASLFALMLLMLGVLG
ncbi:DUF3667 domain-containing protein [Allosphingosinicella sp.]|uniref:DUF3667 domain-containing protein n=1 Tax=Allosphingosinicella sp. TaxID=2823234 RepID=UPI002EDB1783